MDYYVYRFLNKHYQVIYVGRTVNLMTRMNTHFSTKGHLPLECYEQVARIDYIALQTNSDMKIKELYYISKYKPTFNTSDMDEVSFPFNELHDVWVTFDRNKEKKHLMENHRHLEEINSLSNKKVELFRQNEELEKELESLRQKYREIKENQIVILNLSVAERSVSDISYATAIAGLKSNPEATFVNMVEGKVRMSLYCRNDDIVARIYPHPATGQEVGENQEPYRLIILKSSMPKPNKKPEFSDLSDLLYKCTVEFCNNWEQATTVIPEASSLHKQLS